MATCLLHCRPRDGEARCTVAQRLRYGMFLPPPPMGRDAGRARAVGVLVAERPRIPCPPVGPGKHSGRRANDWLALELLLLLSVLLCVQQLQLPWVLDWLALELLLLLP